MRKRAECGFLVENEQGVRRRLIDHVVVVLSLPGLVAVM